MRAARRAAWDVTLTKSALRHTIPLPADAAPGLRSNAWVRAGSFIQNRIRLAAGQPVRGNAQGIHHELVLWAGHFVGGGAASGRAAPAAPRSAQEGFLRLKSRFQWIFYCGKRE
jgi:hypothetical protein